MNQLTVATHQTKLSLWSDRIKECQASGMSTKAWCDSHGISNKTYYYWYRKLKQEVFDELPLKKKEVLLQKKQPVFSEIKQPTYSNDQTAVSIFKNDLRIDIKNNADANTVKMVLDLLGQTC